MRLLDEARKDHSLTIHAYVLMPNHYHLVVETADVLISKAMSDLLSRYSMYFNYKYERSGHLFQGRFKSIIVEKTSYFLELTRYVHLNPIRAGLVKRLQDYRWSSYIEYIGRDDWRRISTQKWALSAFGNGGYKSLKGYKKYLAAGRGVDERIFESGNFAGKILGSMKFARDMLARFGYDDEAKEISAPPAIEIVKLVAEENKVEIDSLLKGGSSTERNIAISLIRSQTGLKLKEVADMFNITHTAVSKAINKLESDTEQDKALKQRLDRLIHKLGTVPSL